MEKGEIAPEEQFFLLSTIFCYLMLDFYVKTGIRFSLRDKRTEVKITRVDYICLVPGKSTSVDAKQAGCRDHQHLHFNQRGHWMTFTLMCLSIGTPKNNKFSICSKWKIHYFQVSQNLGRVQPHYNVLEYWDTYKPLIFHLRQMENLCG